MALDLTNIGATAASYATRHPREIVELALTEFGPDVAISFSGAEDVVLVDLASKIGGRFTVFSLDTGRLHPETYQFLDKVRDHYGIPIHAYFPQPDAVQALVSEKGLFSFYRDGHKECCNIRKVEPLTRALTSQARVGHRTAQGPEPGHARRRAGHPARPDVRTAGPAAREVQSSQFLDVDSRCGRTSASTTCRTTRCTTAASSRSVASPARGRSIPVSTSAKAVGGGKRKRRRSAACTSGT